MEGKVRDSRDTFFGEYVHPQKINRWNLKTWRFGRSSLLFNRVIFEVPYEFFRGVYDFITNQKKQFD